jgi:hypothetical protein
MKRFQIAFSAAVFLALALGFLRERLRPPEEDGLATGDFHPVLLPPLAGPGGSLSLAGTVADHQGAPAAGVQVTLFARDDAQPAEEPLHWTYTAEDGRFSLDHLAPGSVRVVLVAPPLPPSSFDLELPVAEDVLWRLSQPLPPLPVLPEIRRVRLAGVLRPTGGAGAPGGAPAGYEIVLRPAPDLPRASGAVVRRARSDAAGRFEFEELAVARYLVEVLPPWARAGSWPVLALVSGEIHGQLIEAGGRALQGALVQVFALDSLDPAGAPLGWPPTATDAEGRFLVGDLPAGRYRVHVRAGQARREIETRVEPGTRMELSPERIELGGAQGP